LSYRFVFDDEQRANEHGPKLPDSDEFRNSISDTTAPRRVPSAT
jgi:hypothetical protein